MPKKERGLGRGLDALFSSGSRSDIAESLVELDIDQITAREDQPRSIFEQGSLEELAASIREHGLLQPILVKETIQGYEIIAGERRWRAAQMAGLSKISAVIKEITEAEVAEISLIENLQRDDLTAIEEARAYKQILEQHGYTQEELAKRIGKSRAHIANTIRILSLSEYVLNLIEQRKLSAGHARALLSLESQKEQENMARAIVEGKLSVRQTEQDAKERKEKTKRRISEKSADIVDVEERIQKQLGTRAEIVAGRKGGRILIDYYSLEDLERILETMGI